MASDAPPGATRHPQPNRRPERSGRSQPLPPPRTNRLPAYLGQLQEYWFHGPQRRFARDAGVSESTLSRLLRGETNPRYADVCKIVALLEMAAEYAREVLTPGGAFLAKVIQGGTEGTLLATLKRDFATVRHVKPSASRADSAELYLLATGFRG